MPETVLAGPDGRSPAIDQLTGRQLTIEELLRRRGFVPYFPEQPVKQAPVGGSQATGAPMPSGVGAPSFAGRMPQSSGGGVGRAAAVGGAASIESAAVGTDAATPTEDPQVTALANDPEVQAAVASLPPEDQSQFMSLLEDPQVRGAIRGAIIGGPTGLALWLLARLAMRGKPVPQAVINAVQSPAPEVPASQPPQPAAAQQQQVAQQQVAQQPATQSTLDLPEQRETPFADPGPLPAQPRQQVATQQQVAQQQTAAPKPAPNPLKARLLGGASVGAMAAANPVEAGPSSALAEQIQARLQGGAGPQTGSPRARLLAGAGVNALAAPPAPVPDPVAPRRIMNALLRRATDKTSGPQSVINPNQVGSRPSPGANNIPVEMKRELSERAQGITGRSVRDQRLKQQLILDANTGTYTVYDAKGRVIMQNVPPTDPRVVAMMNRAMESYGVPDTKAGLLASTSPRAIAAGNNASSGKPPSGKPPSERVKAARRLARRAGK